MRELPMFPLGTVLLPHMVLPLHVFEPRYRTMLRRVRAADDRFGVTLIERGHEVGGGDRRSSLGTVARIVAADELDDGRWIVLAVGTERLRVVEWLPDDPHPRALVETLPEPAPGAAAGGLRDEVATRLRGVLALAAELGEAAAPATADLDPDPATASYQAIARSGAGPHDAQRLLGAETAEDRLGMLLDVLEDTEAVLRFRLEGTAAPGHAGGAGGDGGDGGDDHHHSDEED